MRPIDMILKTLRENPDGLTTLELGRIVYGENGYSSVSSNTYSKAQRLRKYGLVTMTHEMRPNVFGSLVPTAVWRAVL